MWRLIVAYILPNDSHIILTVVTQGRYKILCRYISSSDDEVIRCACFPQHYLLTPVAKEVAYGNRITLSTIIFFAWHVVGARELVTVPTVYVVIP